MTPARSGALKNNVHGIIFDLDGTIIDSALKISEILNRMRDGYSLPPLAVEKYKIFISLGARELIMRSLEVGEEAVDGLLAEFRGIYREKSADPGDLYDGMEELLQSLSSKGIRMAICSNKPQAICERILSDVGIGGHFVKVLGGDSTIAPKPDKRHVEAALDALGCPAWDAVFIGDSSIDHEAAHRAGVPFVLAAYGYVDKPELVRSNTAIRHPSELLGLLS